jgi:hypothetical protein
MWIAEAALAAVLAIVAGAVLMLVLGWRHPVLDRGSGAIALLFALFVAIWVGGKVSRPFGPEIAGLVWLPFVFTSMGMTALVLAIAPPSWIRKREAPRHDEEPEKALSVAAWLLFACLFLIAALSVIVVAALQVL